VKHKKKPDKQYQSWETGKVFKKVKVKDDTTLSYALYLPKSYDLKSGNSVMFIFDSHAGGVLPVEKYKSLAEKYHIILVASNNSKNGQSATERNRIITGFMEDVKSRFHINNEIYTSGFSGGARVAALIALYNSNVAGMIGCAAGFPQVQNPVNTSFKWIGVVGNQDFNYLELKNLNRQLSANHWKSHLLVFNGKHEWPPAEVMDNAFGLLTGNLKARSKFEVKDKPDEKRLEKEEFQKQRVLARAIEEKSLPWWDKQIAEMNKNIGTAHDDDKKLMNQRLLNYVSMICFIYTDHALKAGKTDDASKYLTIYEKVDPDNPDVWFFKAKRLAMLNKDTEALTAVQTAIDKGFEEFSRFNDKAFDRLKSNPEFLKLTDGKKI
jgi:hypothetical protein